MKLDGLDIWKEIRSDTATPIHFQNDSLIRCFCTPGLKRRLKLKPNGYKNKTMKCDVHSIQNDKTIY